MKSIYYKRIISLEIIHDLENEYLIHNLSTNYAHGKSHSGGLLYVNFESYITDRGKRVLDIIADISV
jgi:hypothetical protein